MAENINWTLYFPSNERCIAEFEILNTKLQVQLKADLTKEVYSQNKLQEKELAVVEYLSKVKKLQDEVLTPESDTYATPELTPTDVKHTFGPTRCVSDSGLSSLIESSKALHSTNTLYYSLVTVDEVYSSDSADILEKELAEQDQLFKSFKSIISKDTKSTKGEVKSFYLTPKNRSASFQNTPKHNSSKKKNGLELKLPLRLSFKDKYSLTQFDNNVNGNVPKKTPLNLEQFANYKEFNSVEDTVNVNYLWNSGSAKKFSFTERQCEPNTMSKVKPETEESMEGESVGEAVSSGYLTGSSPKEHTVSELATSEDIPHDNDRSARSSSVSSDAGTWEHPVVDRQVVLSDHDSSVNITNGDNLNIEAFTICYPANSHQKNISSGKNNSSSCKEFPTNYEYSQIGSSESGNGSQTHSSPSTNEEMALDNKLCNGKSNFFIDAASLLDESEISSIPPNSLSYNGHEFGEYNSLPLWSDNTLSDKPLEVANNLDQVVNHENKLKQKDISPKSDTSDLEMRRSSLIRRNTFELEPDDERLAVLRNEYERHKQRVNHQHQNSFNSSSKGGFVDDASLNNFQFDEKNPPNSLPVALTQPKSITKVDDDMHSPDSLNNDNPAENPFETCLRNGNPSYSLPYDLNSSSKNGKQLVHDHPNQNSESLQSSNSNQCDNMYKECERQSSVNKLDSAPILSGGVSLKDISSPEKPFSSPLMNRRKTELAPIVSGGAVMEPEVEPEPRPRTASSLSSSWVVDMSDTVKSPQECRKNRKRDPLSSVNSSDSPKSEESAKPVKANNSGLGFFVPLDDPFDEKSPADSGYKSSNFHSIKDCESEKSISRVETSSNSKNISNSGSSCGFYVDFNDTKTARENSVDKESAPADKKLFSMFIDISESGDSGTKSKTSSPLAFKKRTHSRNHSGVFSQKSDEKSRSFNSQVSSESSLEITESPEVSLGQRKESGPPMHLRQIFGPPNSSNVSNKNKKQGFYMFVDADPSPTAQRKTLPSSSQSSSQRHSWNSDCDSPLILPAVVNSDNGRKKVHRRSHSVSVNKSLEVMFNVENQEQSSTASPAFKVSTSNSIGYESGPSSIDDVASRHHNSMMASWHGSVKPSSELQKVLETVEKKENSETKTHTRTLVKSRSESKSEHLSEMSKSDMTYSSSRDDNLCDLSKTSNESSSGINNSTFVVSDVSNVANATSSEMELTTPTCDLASQLSRDDSDKTETDFDEHAGPKSADIPRTPDHSISQVEIPTVEHKFSFVKLSDMDKEPKKKSVEGKSVMNRMSRSIPEASWIESKMMTRSATSRSLSRLFPHLRNKTPDSADHDTDYSEMSSMQSSMDPSALEGSTEDTDISSCGGPVSRLGEDLLRMFLDEISPDVTVEVGGRRIKAHKCILSSRCQYFAAILSGGWVESAGNVISLQGFSYSAVHFALCHIYSGASNIPDSINIVELATLADMLCLEGLKEVIMYTLKVKYCHFFHKPCPMCTVGVLECLPLAAAYGLDEIYRKSLRWITKYFVRVWPTKGFATLPRELLDKCYKQHIVHMTVDNILETVLCCSKLQGLIPNVRWAEPVFALANKLHDAAVKFIALHFSDILSSDMFMSLGKEQMWSMSQLEETLLSAAEKLPPDQACKCHSHLYKLTTAIQAPSPSMPLPLSVNDGFVEFLRLLSSTVEGCLLKQAARASRTPAWTLMEPHLRHKIQDAACLVIVPGDDRRRARHLLKRGEGSAPNKRSVDSAASKPGASETVTTKKATPSRSSLPPATTKPKTPQPTNKAENSGPRPKTWPYKISEVKSRYLEPKQTPKQSPALAAAKQDKPNLTPTARRSMNKQMISSSDSSRTSSPATRRSVPVRPASAGKREDLTMSTDSLADPPLKKKPDTAQRIDFVERNMRAISIKGNTIKFPSTEVTTQRKASSISRIEGEKPRYSPMSKRSSSQSSPAAAAVKSTVNSTPSPSNRHNTLSPKEKSHVAETKSSMLKRTSTYRVQPKSASPVKATTRTKEPTATSPNIKGNLNKIQAKVNGSKKSSANNNNLSNYNKTEQRPQPMVGSRSGTFLKDEPTVLKKPQVVNVSE